MNWWAYKYQFDGKKSNNHVFFNLQLFVLYVCSHTLSVKTKGKLIHIFQIRKERILLNASFSRYEKKVLYESLDMRNCIGDKSVFHSKNKLIQFIDLIFF